MNEHFARLIEIAGAALEAEDRYFLGAIAANKIAYPNGRGGILRIKREHYYQFIVARALASSFPFAAKVEVDRHDLVLTYPDDCSKRFAVVEMKLWMSPKGTQEIPSIQRDIIDRLQSCRAEHALMLVFSANPIGKTEENLGKLSEWLGISPPDGSAWKSYRFFTVDELGDEVDFWVAGYEVK